MSHRNNDVFRNKPQFETNPTLNKNLSPDVPTFNSNAMGDQGFAPLNNCSNGCCGNHENAHKKNSNHECCHGEHSNGHKHKGCHCDHK